MHTDSQDPSLTHFDINAMTAHAVIHGFVHGTNRAGEWVEVRAMPGAPGGYALKAQLIDDHRSSCVIDIIRSLLVERVIVQRLIQCPSDVISVQWAVGLDEVSEETTAVYARSAGCIAGGSL